MLARINALLLTGMVTAMLALEAVAQTASRAPSGPPQFSIEKAWNWLIARPGVLIAAAIAIAAIAFMVYASRRKKA
jgi:hypothetical protein